MVGVLYFIVISIATTLGAIAGIGGGIIIKPILDSISYHDVDTIGFLSSFAVFVMSIVSTYKQMRAGTKIKGILTLYLAIGSIIGGVLGKVLFSKFMVLLSNADLITIIQSTALALSLVFVLIYINNKSKFKTYHVKNKFITTIIGLLLGMFASFLGIGGGPINVAVLTIFFSMNIKNAAIHSIVIIFFSQLAKLSLIYVYDTFANYDVKMLIYIIPAAVFGGMVGSSYNKRLDKKTIGIIFNISLIAIIVFILINIVTFIYY